MENLIKRIQNFVPVSKELEDVIMTNFNKELIKKKKMLLREGQYCKKLYYLDIGLVRTLYYHKELKTLQIIFQPTDIWF